MREKQLELRKGNFPEKRNKNKISNGFCEEKYGL